MEVIIIGAGASGMMAAVAAADMGACVTVLEHNEDVGKKLKRTGNGRCNLGNRDLRVDCYHSYDSELLDDFFMQFDTDDTVRTFRSLGLLVKEEGGYLYPVCEQASTVVDVFATSLKNYGVDVITGVNIESVTKTFVDKFEVKTATRTYTCDRVILACGSYAGIDKKDRIDSSKDGYSLAYSLGHTVLPVKPALTSIKCSDDFFKDIAGVRTDAVITLLQDGHIAGSEYGQLQFTDYGLSGIPAFQLSHYVAADPEHEYEMMIDLMPGVDEDEYISLMQSRMFSQQDSTVEEFFLGTINSKLCSLLIRLADLNPLDKIEEGNEDKLITAISMMRCLKVKITGTKDFAHSQCCSGGVMLREIDRNCMSIKTPGLYICGEMLDVDGICGGYNLQWAWTSGYIAGRNAATY